MSKRDYYEVLSVTRTATNDEIRASYRKLAFKYHPDRNPDDPEAELSFKEAAEAYEVLRNPEKRSRYDQFGHEGVQGNGFNGFNNSEDIFSRFGDIFADFFSFGGQAGGQRAGADLRYNLTVSFREAAKGTQVDLKLPKKIHCDRCSGSGSEPGYSAETCQHCQGQGQVLQSQGFFRIATPCPVCHGQGKIIPHPCSKCRGVGIVKEVKELKVRIPAGVDNGSRLRLRGEGEPGESGGPPGDLYVVIFVEEDKEFQRQGQDLITQVEISFIQAILGARIEVPTLDEPMKMDIPKGTQSGRVFQLRGCGLPHLGSAQKGSLLVEIIVTIPSKISKRQEELLLDFQNLEEESTIDKVKGLFTSKKKKKAKSKGK